MGALREKERTIKKIRQDSELILSDSEGKEIGNIKKYVYGDFDIGNKNDFSIHIKKENWNKNINWYKCRLFIPGTEYGGVVKELESGSETDDDIVLSGLTWRGRLKRKVVKPPPGSLHLILNGDINDCLRTLIGDKFGDLFIVPDVKTGIVVTKWQVDRFVRLNDAIDKLLKENNLKLQINYIEPKNEETGHVEIQAVQIVDYTDLIEYSSESKANLIVKENKNGINHLVCVGKGENEERTVIDLYIQEDGSVGKNQFYFGEDEEADLYEYTSAEADKLEEEGTKRLENLKNFKKADANLKADDIDLEIGDMIAGYESMTETRIAQPIQEKILRIKDGTIKIEYKIKGDG